MSNSEVDSQTGLPIGALVAGSPAAWPDAKVLPGQTIRLEALNLAVHGDALWEALGGTQNAALWLYMSLGPFAHRSEFEAAIQTASEKSDPVFFAVVNAQTSRAVGWCAFLNIQPNQRSIEIGWLMFSPDLQRTKSATEALYLMARYAFDDLGYRRYEWKCNALNEKSMRAAKRFGFTFEGIFRHHTIVKGRNRDSAWFSIVAEEWPAVKSALENWLSAANFDASGRQLKALSELMDRHQTA